jgi:magnesium-transporting ATPase (P-type)
MLVSSIILAILFAVLGIVFIGGRGAFLIAGYNTLSKAEKEKYDVKALCRFMGKSMFALSVCCLIPAFSDVVGNMIPFWIGINLSIVVIIFVLIYANTGNRFKR